ncbi:hypothetical protein QVD17_16046 [Tagetes erecta]|uniref:Uncharacterized protein n=1 Tax=Tagetes erecta TaxID=13708 RepID=A0AAD8KR01_TARER|nr:hypothetical protein QVD17_16046 [Tagetes erecta]
MEISFLIIAVQAPNPQLYRDRLLEVLPYFLGFEWCKETKAKLTDFYDSWSAFYYIEQKEPLRREARVTILVRNIKKSI